MEKFKKYLPVFLVVFLGLLLIGGGIWFFRGLRQAPQKAQKEEKVLRELSLEERPFTSLTPRADGHEFHLAVAQIPDGVDSLEYELVYQNADGVTQGVPGTVKLKGATTLERDLLLGSCSAGKCKYDEGVEEGTFTLRLRDEDGKLISKLETGFRLDQGGRKLESSDGKFSFSGTLASNFYLTMGTFGLPEEAPGEVLAGPYGIFTRGKTSVSGTVEIDGTGTLFGWNAVPAGRQGKSWVSLPSGQTSFLGTFVLVSE